MNEAVSVVNTGGNALFYQEYGWKHVKKTCPSQN